MIFSEVIPAYITPSLLSDMQIQCSYNPAHTSSVPNTSLSLSSACLGTRCCLPHAARVPTGLVHLLSLLASARLPLQPSSVQSVWFSLLPIPTTLCICLS